MLKWNWSKKKTMLIRFVENSEMKVLVRWKLKKRILVA
jgi:hypothetical protein